MKKIIAFLLLIISVPAFAGGKKVKTDAEWLQTEYEMLSAIKDPAKIPEVGLTNYEDKDNDGVYIYYPKGNGRIVFSDKSWVLLVSHSGHADDGLSDLTLIRASDGKYYVSKGHVCSQLILDSEGKITSLETFLKTKGKVPKEKSGDWEEYKVGQASAEDKRTK